ncbi:MAG TPA: DUF2807 domain-containing protein [Gammaproteobacteria bacterium]|nr:DUF2807 domain-containing protein [Gammaproteobacteria bacterium]
MKSLLSLSTLAVLSVSTHPTRAQDGLLRNLEGFDGIGIQGSIQLEITQGPNYRVEVDVDEPDDAEIVSTEARGTTLEIRQRDGGGFFGFFEPDLEVAVTLPELKSLNVSAGAEVESNGRISGEVMTIRASAGSASSGSDVVYSGNPGSSKSTSRVVRT